MKKHKFAFIFLIFSMVLLLLNIAIIVVFSIIKIEDRFFNSLNVASLSISFLSFIASSFFSFSVYLQTEKQNKINESLPKKDDQYIIANYSLFNVEREISFFSLVSDEKESIIETGRYLRSPNFTDEQNITRLVFLPTDSMNQPTYKVLVKSLSFFNSKNQSLFQAKVDENVDGEYSANILQRGYNCICVDIASEYESIKDLFAKSRRIELRVDIISVFNVKMSVAFSIYLDSEKNVDNNPDKKNIVDLNTYLIHHSNYFIEDKSIVSVE